ncbi:lytic transglycosylase domain-containing protein [Escherichia albertii]|uniref:lytic transglycosylase domain-containing protein n=1 Tax=Escherichia albertii TaxID=208962 RepID=UPI002016561F|nr:lytic transglycosylase domain-containing protein [Escherichia albertii]MCZ8687426.1 lytic transglycosylase domain-containing protein [Escherichia albertii]MCZ8730141.1 lytic transglycosylase domain-containing protein [Escherichia albertii]MCZ8882239.1 lytic transglycosylase domain-containing protein [Escherichia albertii]MCZ8894753.1 lytic transglycosylase domain-containing protein [Escherichia albertii]
MMKHKFALILIFFTIPVSATQWCYEDASGMIHVTPRQTSKLAKLCVISAMDTEISRRWSASTDSSSIPFPEAFPHQPVILLRDTHDYDKIIRYYAHRYAVDPYLVKAVMAAESGFNPDSVSEKGAVGLMQLMPGTAKRLYMQLGYRKNKRQFLDPFLNIQLGTFYLSELRKIYNGNIDLILAAYNAGEGNVKKYNNIVPPFMETRKYIDYVKSKYHHYLDGK